MRNTTLFFINAVFALIATQSSCQYQLPAMLDSLVQTIEFQPESDNTAHATMWLPNPDGLELFYQLRYAENTAELQSGIGTNVFGQTLGWSEPGFMCGGNTDALVPGTTYAFWFRVASAVDGYALTDWLFNGNQDALLYNDTAWFSYTMPLATSLSEHGSIASNSFIRDLGNSEYMVRSETSQALQVFDALGRLLWNGRLSPGDNYVSLGEPAGVIVFKRSDGAFAKFSSVPF